jgi:serine/threonine protein kinase
MTDALPQVFGRFVLRERIAAGGMAEVFRAGQPGFGGFEKTVAVKRMFDRFSHDKRFVEMLVDEAKIVSQLAHPNIVPILDVGEVDGRWFIALELIDGTDLFRLLQRQYELGRHLPVAVAMHIVAELCSALDYAHARRASDDSPLNIVHRDVSPQNVLLSYQGEVKLTDFGIAKAAYRYTQTQAGVVKGKLYYMSPEQAAGTAIDHRSDLFAAGILLFELLCTRPLYDEEDQAQLLDRVRHARWQWPTKRRKALPDAAVAVVERALSADPDARYPTGRSMREAIKAAMRSEQTSCDHETLGAYVREVFDIPDVRPERDTTMSRMPLPAVDTHWHIQTGHGVTPPPDADTRVPAPDPPQRTTEPAEATTRIAAPDDTEDHDDDDDTSTELLDVDEIRRRLAASAPAIPAPSPHDEATVIGLSPLAEVADPGLHEEATKAIAAMPDEPPAAAADAAPPPDPASAAQDEPTAVVRGAPEEATAMISLADIQAELAEDRARSQHSAPVPTDTPRPGPSRFADPDDAPASWGLVALTATVWAGVVALAAYATLLMSS